MTASDKSGPPSGDEPERVKPVDPLRDRLDTLRGRLDVVEKREEAQAASEARRSKGGSDLGQAFRLSTEFMAGIIAGGGLGWAIDWAFGTSPWGLIVCVMLGFGAGVMNAMRAAGFGGKKRTGL